MREHDVSLLDSLAQLLRQRCQIEAQIADIVGRPALRGHIGEYIAACIFDIDLHQGASARDSDGHFRGGPLRGRTVNVKFYARWEGLLDMHVGEGPPEFYLVMVGNGSRSWGIEQVYLFSHMDLVKSGVVPRTACSVRSTLSDAAMLYPTPAPACPLRLSASQEEALTMFQEGGRF